MPDTDVRLCEKRSLHLVDLIEDDDDVVTMRNMCGPLRQSCERTLKGQRRPLVPNFIKKQCCPVIFAPQAHLNRVLGKMSRLPVCVGAHCPTNDVIVIQAGCKHHWYKVSVLRGINL